MIFWASGNFRHHASSGLCEKQTELLMCEPWLDTANPVIGLNLAFCASANPSPGHPFVMRYSERLRQRIQKTGSHLCVGLDPRPGDGGVDGARDFLKRVIEETTPWAAAFKPNMAYFEAMGIDGIRLLEDLLAGMPNDVPVILDAKRSDIGETQKYYAQGYFGRWNVDAVTLNPFLGFDSIEPFLDWEGKGVYLLAVTSNAGSADFQRQKLVDGRSVFELVTAKPMSATWLA